MGFSIFSSGGHLVQRNKTILAILVEGHPKNYFLFYPITLGGRRGTTDEFATIPFHLDLFSAALVELAKSRGSLKDCTSHCSSYKAEAHLER